MDWQKEDKKYFGSIFKQINTKFQRCFWPEGSCAETAIRAHSIQKSGVLDLLCDNNKHVIMPQIGLDINRGPVLTFEKVGRNKATTFTGLCDKHDTLLFEPIDKNDFTPDNHEYMFLLAYRSVLRELHVKMKSGVDIQSHYMRGVNLGRFNPDDRDQPMMMATMALAEAYMFYLYKFHYDQIYLKRDFKQIYHKIEFVENIEPSIAASSVYSYIDNMRLLRDRRNPKCIVLNIFPHDKGLYIVFSFRKDQKNDLLPHIIQISQAERHYKLYLVSKLVLIYCENFVISPKFFNTLSAQRIETIKEFFMKNMFLKKENCEDNNLYLFK
jgi:hypothetical protein